MDFLTPALITSVISMSVTALFSANVLLRWRRHPRHPMYLLAWGIGLLMFAAGTLSQVVLTFTWSPLFFALWYWTGALMVPPWLGQGTAYLLIRRGNIARNIQMALLLVMCMTLPWTLFFTEFNPQAWHPGADMTLIYRDHVGENGEVVPGIMQGESRGTVRFFSPIMNVWGTVLLVGGAIYSARAFRRREIMRNRVIGNWLIAAGGLIPALGGALIRLGDPSFKYLGEMIGAILIFAGFLYTVNVPEKDETPTDAANLQAAKS